MVDTDEDKVSDDDDDEQVVFTRESVAEFVREVEIRTGQVTEPVVMDMDSALEVVAWHHGDPRPAPLRAGIAPPVPPADDKDPGSADE